MAEGDLIDRDWQVEARGKLLGPTTLWRVGGLENFKSRIIKPNDTPRTSSHGSRAGTDYIDAHAKILHLNCGTLPQDEAVAELDALSEAWAPGGDDVIVFQLGGEKLRRHGRYRDIDADLSQLAVGYLSVICEFVDEEGLAYSAVLHSETVGLPTPGAGVALPFVLPITLPAGTSNGFLSAYNAGTMPAPWTARLDGPLSEPTITHQGSGRQLQFTANGGLDIPAGSWVDVDSQRKTVLYNGVGDRRLNLLLGQGWFDLDPGDNAVGLTADTGSGTLTFNWRDTYL